MQLAQVGDARVAAEVGGPADHALERALGGVVAAELDPRVDEHRVWGVDVGRRGAGAAGQSERGAEVVAGRRERGGLGERRGAGRMRSEHGLGARVEGRVAGLPRTLRERGGELGLARLAAADRRLQAADLLGGRDRRPGVERQAGGRARRRPLPAPRRREHGECGDEGQGDGGQAAGRMASASGRRLGGRVVRGLGALESPVNPSVGGAT